MSRAASVRSEPFGYAQDRRRDSEVEERSGQAEQATRRPAVADSSHPCWSLLGGIPRAVAIVAFVIAALGTTYEASAQVDIPVNSPLIPPTSGFVHGDEFRLLVITQPNFFSSVSDSDNSNDIAHLNSLASAGVGLGSRLAPYKTQFRALASTKGDSDANPAIPAVDARDNTLTTGTGVPIWWYNGAKVADDYADFYDGSWDSNSPRDHRGTTLPGGWWACAWTGTLSNGVKSHRPFGSNDFVTFGCNSAPGKELSDNVGNQNVNGMGLYALSPVFRVNSATAPLPPPSPQVTSVEITSTPTATTNTYGLGEVIEVTLTWDAAVTVTGDPHIIVSIAGNKEFPYLRGNHRRKLVFGYTVQSTDTDTDGIYLYGGTRTDSGVKLDSNDKITLATDSNVDADLSVPRLPHGAQGDHKVNGGLTPPADSSPPTFESAVIASSAPKDLVITFNEALDTTSTPAASAFTVQVDGTNRADAAEVTISGSTVTLTMPVAFDSGETPVTVAYTKPGSGDVLQDGSGNEVATFTAKTVTNNAPACPAVVADAFWSTCVTIGHRSVPPMTGHSPIIRGSAISDTTFDFDGTPYELEGVFFAHEHTGTSLRTTWNASTLRNWVLLIEGQEYGFDDATQVEDNRQIVSWASPSFSWDSSDAGRKVTVSLHRAPEATEGTEGELRLTGGASANEGRLEIFLNGQWGSVCNDGWDRPNRGAANAGAACAILHRQNSSIPAAAGTFTVTHTFNQCTVNYDGTAPPVYSFVAGERTSTRSFLSEATFPSANPPTPPSVCRSKGSTLATTDSVTVNVDVTPPPAGGRFWLDDLRCNGSETSLTQCAHTGVGVHNCKPNEAVYVRCGDKVEQLAQSNLPPDPPGAPRVSALPGDGRVTLSWAAPEYDRPITGWQVRHGAVDGDAGTVAWGEWAAIEGPGAGTRSHTVTGLDNGTFYFFQVRAMAGAIEGTESVPLSLAPRLAPGAPADLAATVVSDHSATLAWTLPAQPGGGYVDEMHLERLDAEGGVAWSALVAEEPDAETAWEWRVDGLDPGTAYRFRVRLAMESGATKYSAVADVTTETEPSLGPEALAVTASRPEAVSLAWTIPEQPSWVTATEGTFVRVLREMTAPATEPEQEVGQVDWTRGETAYTFTDESVFAGRHYRYRIEAAVGERVHTSAWAEAQTPAATTDPDASPAGATALDVAQALRKPWYLRGTRLGQSWPPPGNPSIEWLKMVLAPGTYYIRVEAQADRATGYYLRFGLKDPPPSASVADARAEEGVDATLDFVVTLDRQATRAVTVDYATADGTATAGEDYTATAGTLRFAAGETSQTIAVPVLDDVLDEGEETLTLRLTNPQGGALLDGDATGTIANSDPLQQAWLARFGRTVATHVTDAVGERLRGTGEQGSHLTVGGYRLPLGRQAGTPSPLAGEGQGEGGQDAGASMTQVESSPPLPTCIDWTHR